jgi:hypothetical protein
MFLANGLEIRLHGRCHARFTTMTKICEREPTWTQSTPSQEYRFCCPLAQLNQANGTYHGGSVWIRTDAYTWQTSVVHCGTWLQCQMEGRELLRLRCPTEAEEKTISICIDVSNPDLSDD